MSKYILYNEKCCGTCRYRQYDEKYADFVCQCEGSECCGDWIDEEQWCDRYEGK